MKARIEDLATGEPKEIEVGWFQALFPLSGRFELSPFSRTLCLGRYLPGNRAPARRRPGLASG